MIILLKQQKKLSYKASIETQVVSKHPIYC